MVEGHQQENDFILNSSEGLSLSTLARHLNVRRLSGFLIELLNLRSHDLVAVERLCVRFPEFMPSLMKVPCRASWTPQQREAHVRATNLEWNSRFLDGFRATVQVAWLQPTTIGRQVMLLNPLYRVLTELYG